MVTTGVILAMLAVMAAIGAVYRVRDKRAVAISARSGIDDLIPPSQATPQATVSQATVRDSETSLAQTPYPQGDRDLTAVLTDPPVTRAVPPEPVVLSPIAPAPEADVLLAASLSVSDLVQLEATAASASSQRLLAFPDHDSAATAAGKPHSSPSVLSILEEVERLGRTGQIDPVAPLARYVYHSDPAIRVAVAFALGERAKRQQGRSAEAIVPVLSKLTQDANPQVRLQAVIALGEIHSSEVLPLLEHAQRQTDARIRQAASAALQQLKFVQPQQHTPVPKPIYDQQQTGQVSHS